jgi:hypothetical protein
MVIMRVLIFCAGSGERWQSHLNVPKQLAPIPRQPLLFRTLQLLLASGIKDIYTISNEPKLNIKPAKFFTPEKCNWWIETFISTKSLWKRKTVILLGDVYFSPLGLKTILSDSASIRVFGRPGPSKVTGTPHGECFALSYSQSQHQFLQNCANKVLKDAKKGGRGKVWELYQTLCGFPLNKQTIIVEKNIFKVIDDLTDDIDSPLEYINLLNTLQYLPFIS